MNPPLKKLKGKALDWAKKSMELDFDEEDEADEDTLNRILWYATRGEQNVPGGPVMAELRGPTRAPTAASRCRRPSRSARTAAGWPTRPS